MVSGKKIAILGNGFLGRNLYDFFSIRNNCTAIDKDNYDIIKNQNNLFDIFINANGNSKKFLPETDPLLDFNLSVQGSLKSVLDFKFNKYVLLSSCEVYNDLSNRFESQESSAIDVSSISRYGLSKYLSECIIRKYCKNWLILRLNCPVGYHMKKGAIYDIINEHKLYISSESEFQILHIQLVNDFLNTCLINDNSCEIYNVCSNDSMSLNSVAKILNKQISTSSNTKIIHNINNTKASSFYNFGFSIDSINLLKDNI